MISILSKFFIKQDENTKQSDLRRQYGVLLGGVGIFLNICLFIIKIIGGILSGSVAIVADAFNNLSDGGSSLIQLIGYKLSGHDPDPEHPFGHGRLEYVSGLIISILIIVVGVELLISSARRIIDPVVIEYSRVTVVILIVSVFIKVYMYYYNKRYSEKLDSVVFQATAYDSLSDCVATSAVLISTMVSEYMNLQIDAYCGILVSMFIIFTGIKSAKDTINPLLGSMADPEYVEKIAKFVLSYDDVYGVHDLVVHDYGAGRTMITLHVEVPANGDFVKLHDTVDNIERKLNAVLGCKAVIHMDPVFIEDEDTIRMKRLCDLVTKSIDESLSIHDFRMIAGPTHINLVFDVLAPFELKMSNDEIKEKVERKIADIPGNLTAIVDIDRPL